MASAAKPCGAQTGKQADEGWGRAIPSRSRQSVLEILAERLATRQCLTEPLQEVRARLVAAQPEASGIVSLVTGLYDPGLDPRWLPALWPCTQLVILTTAVGLGVSADCQ